MTTPHETFQALKMREWLSSQRLCGFGCGKPAMWQRGPSHLGYRCDEHRDTPPDADGEPAELRDARYIRLLSAHVAKVLS